MARHSLETSCVVTIFRVAYKRYYQLERWFCVAYENSALCGTVKAFCGKVIVAFRYSFLGKITEVNEGNGNPAIIDNSRVVRSTVNFYNKWKARLLDYFGTSSIVNSAMEFKKDLYLSSVKTGGMVVFVAVLTNILLSLFLRKEISVFGWSMRGVLLFVGFWGMFCEVGWQELKKTSRVMKRIGDL